MRLADYVADLGPVWDALTREHDLVRVPLAGRVLWPYADYLFAPEWDIISSTAKARRDGFGETVDTPRMFLEVFDRFRAARLIP